MLDRFLSFVQRKNLCAKGQPVLLSVSGGVDSVALCELFNRAGQPFGIAHCNFLLRGAESDEDEAFVGSLAQSYGVHYWAERFDTESLANREKISVQMAARALRYGFLESVRKENGFHAVATAHHLNDSMETILFNLAKGTGISGLHGILPRHGHIIRPLLFASREEIERFASENRLTYRTDSSNLTDKYSRNRIRRHVIPVLKDINPGLEDTFRENIAHFRDAGMLYGMAVELCRKKIVRKEGEEIWISIAALRRYPFASTLLHEILFPYGFNPAQAGGIAGALDASPGKQFLSGTHRLIRDRKFLILAPLSAGAPSRVWIEHGQEKVEMEGMQLLVREEETVEISRDPSVATLDAGRIEYPLLLRRWMPGDYFYPFGMKRKKKKLKRFFTDLKLPLPEKEKIRVLLSGERIVWVAGFRIDDRFAVTEETKRVLRIEIKFRK